MTTPLRASAEVRTDAPERYAKQLVSHLGRKVAFTTDGAASTATFAEHGTGWVVVGEGVLTLVAEAHAPEGLVVTWSGATAAPAAG